MESLCSFDRRLKSLSEALPVGYLAPSDPAVTVESSSAGVTFHASRSER